MGDIVDYAIRVEIQAPHAHTVIWIKDALKLGHDTDSDVCKFIDKYISCEMPTDNEQLKEHVQMLQHKHSSYCKRGRGCRFLNHQVTKH